MNDHLRYSGLTCEEQRRALADILWSDPLVREALIQARSLELPDWLLVSGALYNTVWNHLTGRPSGHGIKDFDLCYFDDTDLSWEAEDAVIMRAARHFDGFAKPVEVRNQARVHIWFEGRFGRPYPRLARCQ
ncbi:nucleotidyltransferase family protein, partial [Rhizobiaceae sp. 2RAB30]